MSVEVFWRLPLDGDGRSLSAASWNRGDFSPHRKSPHPFARTGNQRDGYTYYDHLSQIARAAELTRFNGVWLPYAPAGEDPLIVAGALAREARRLQFVASLLSPLHSAVYAAKIGNSFQRLSGGRLSWHFATEAEGPHWHGRSWPLSEQIARTKEFLDVAKGFWTRGPFSYKGTYYEVEEGGFPPALQGAEFPRVYLSGETDDALELSALHGDVHVLALAPVAEIAKRIEDLDARAARHRRRLSYALQADVVARHTDDEAWAELRQRWDHARRNTGPVEVREGAGPPLGNLPDFDALITGPNGWAGFGLVRPGPTSGLVGSYANVADRIAEYAQAGVTGFVLSANPHLEEAYVVGERVLPLVRARVDHDWAKLSKSA